MNAPFKGKGPVSASYACGGPVVGSRSQFMKVPDQFRTDKELTDLGKTGKGGKLSKLEGDKSLPAIKPSKG